MFRQKRRFVTWLSATLLLVIGGLGRAEAGIVISDPTIMPVGNALAAYDLQISLAPNTSLDKNDFVTLLDVQDFDAKASYAFMVGGVDYSKAFTIVATPGTLNGASNIQFIFNLGPPVMFGNSNLKDPLPIGNLILETSMPFAGVANSSLVVPIKYDSQAHQYDSNTIVSSPGVTVRPTVVPEPASLALVGAGMVPAWLLIRRRRRATGRR